MRDARPSSPRGLTDTQWLLRGALGIALYASLVIAPVAFMLLAAPPEARTFLRELSVSLAFAALAVLGLQIVLTARLKRLKAPYGVDAVYHFHKVVSFVAVALVVAHVVLLVVDDPATLELFNVLTAPVRARFAVLATVTLFAVVALSWYRRRIGLGYEAWRWSHGALALVMLGSAVAHVELVGYYVSGPLKRELWIAYVVLWVAAIAWARLVKPGVMLRRPWIVEEVRPERGRTWTLSLAREGAALPFEPGQFVWLHLGASPYAMTEHPFSISSSAQRTDRVELTIKELGDFTSRIRSTPVGTRAYLDGPYGQFSVDRHSADAYVFIAGGVGITPTMSMLRTLRDRGDRRPLTLIYGVETLDEMTFAEELDGLARELELDLVPVVSRPPDGWEGERGWIGEDVLARHIPADSAGVEYFVCGPEPMMVAVSTSLGHLGVHASQVRYELFGLV